MVIKYLFQIPFKNLDNPSEKEWIILNNFWEEFKLIDKKYLLNLDTRYNSIDKKIIFSGKFQSEVKRETFNFIRLLKKYNIKEELKELEKIMKNTYSKRTKISWWEEFSSMKNLLIDIQK